MIYETRPYQEAHIDDIVRLLGKHKNVLAQLPTGGGKTVEFSKLVHRYHNATGKSVLILVHREELMYQSQATLESMFGEKMSLIKAGTKWVDFTPAYIGMVESVYKRIEQIISDDMNIGMVIIDEAHQAMFNKLINFFTKELIIGFTATPKSSSKKEPLNKRYGAIAVGPSIKTLIGLGNLCQNITRSPREVVEKAKLAIDSTGEYAIQQMADEFMKTKYLLSTFTAYKKFSNNKKTIIFNVNIEHSKELTSIFQDFDVPCKHVDGTTPINERHEIFKWFRETPNAVLCNVGVATLGFDEPTIETVIVNRSTTSMPLWLQMCGRGSRPITPEWIGLNQYKYPYKLSVKKKFQIIDMGGNCISHGDWSQDRDWHYVFNNPDLPGADGIAPVKECPQCGCYVHAATVQCKEILPETDEICGYIFDRKKYEEEKRYTEFIIVTEDPVIEELLKNIKQNSYSAFFEAAVRMIDLAEENMEMDDVKREDLFNVYFSFVEKWHKNAFPDRYFNEKWHRQLAKFNFNKYYNYRFTKKLEMV